MGKKKKKAATVMMAAILVLALSLAATLAWSNEEDSEGEIDGTVTPKVRLHDDNDFDDTETANGIRNRDIYVENTGDTKVYVRIRLDEYLKLGEKSLIQGAIQTDKSTWKPHLYTEGNNALCKEEFHEYFTWNMGNTNPVPYKSDVKNYYDNTSIIRDKQTGTAGIVTMKEYIEAETKQANCWYVDTDGYAYWYTQLEKDTATGLLLDSITNLREIEESYYYGVNAKLEAVTESDLNAWLYGTAPTGKTKAANRATVEGVKFLKDISPNYIKITDAMNATDPKAGDYDGDGDGYLTKEEHREYSKASGIIKIDESNFPDEAFRNSIKSEVDVDKSNTLTPDEVLAVTNLNISNQGIKNLKGIEKLTKLTTLDCSGNKMMKLELSGNPELISVKADNQAPDPIKLTYNTAEGTYESIPELFLTGTAFAKGGTADTDVTLREDGGLTVANYMSGKTTDYSVAVGRTKASLGTLSGTAGFLPEEEPIDINAVNFPDEALRSVIDTAAVDKDGDHKLSKSELYALQSLNLSGKPVVLMQGLDLFPNLTVLDCSGSNLTELDLSKTPHLTALNVSGNQIKSMDFTKTPSLNNLNWSNNNLETMDISKAVGLTVLDCSNNHLTKLDISSNAAITSIVGGNQTVSADVTYVAATKQYKSAAGIFLTGTTSASSDAGFDTTGAVTVSNYESGKTSGFTSPLAVGNLTGTINYRGWVEMNSLNFPDAVLRGYIAKEADKNGDGKLSDTEVLGLESIDLSGKTISDMTGLEVFGNLVSLTYTGSSLTSLDLSKTPHLTTLNVSDNLFTTLDVSQVPLLRTLNCSNNHLKTLNLNSNTSLLSVTATGQTMDVALSYDTSIVKYKSAASTFASGTTMGNSSTLDPLSGVVSITSDAGTTDTYKNTISYGNGRSAVVSGTVTYTKSGSLKESIANTGWDKIIDIGGTKWWVVSNDGTTAELLTEECITKKVFSPTGEYNWGTSAVRAYLKDTYYNTLSADLKAIITPMTLLTPINGGWTANETTIDKVYLLGSKSMDEFWSVKGAMGREMAAGTELLKSTGAENWWLRTPGYDRGAGRVTCEAGLIFEYGGALEAEQGVRPAVTVILK